MSILDKFADFETWEDKRVSQDDKSFLERLQERYESSLLFYSRVEALADEENTKYGKDIETSSASIKSLEIYRKVNDLQKSFSSAIYYYFKSKYNVSLNDEAVKNFSKTFDSSVNDYMATSKERDKIRYRKQNYQTYLNDIINQLGGMNFNDLEVKQLKESARKYAYNTYKDEWEIKVKGNVFSFTWGYCSEWYGKYRFNKSGFFGIIADIISNYLYGKTVKLVGCDYFYNAYEIEIPDDDMGRWLEFGNDEKITGFKFFKNGRFDIKFKTPQDARDFAREWFGYSFK